MSTLKADSISTLAGASTSMANAVNGCAKAWVNFNGTGAVAIRASYNVSSITDNAVGDWRANFTNPVADTNFAVVAMGGGDTNSFMRGTATKTTSSVRLSCVGASPVVANDTEEVGIVVFR